MVQARVDADVGCAAAVAVALVVSTTGVLTLHLTPSTDHHGGVVEAVVRRVQRKRPDQRSRDAVC